MARGARFQAIDLRWGVSDEAGLDQRTMPLCLDEIERCQKADRPNFLILLGNRYGWRPLPATIPASEFDRILERVDDEEVVETSASKLTARQRLEKWYVLDDNAKPAEYYLEPRDPDGPFGTSLDPVVKQAKAEAWDEEAAAMRASLLEGIDGLDLSSERETDSEARSKYVASATEQEIEQGAFRVPDAPDHVFCFFRDIEDLPGDVSAKAYRDLVWPDGGGDPVVDEDAEAALVRLKQRIGDYLPANVVTSSVSWLGDGPELGELPEPGEPCVEDSASYVEAFCAKVEARLTAAIEARLALDEGADSVALEVDAHVRFAEDRAKFFTGRNDAIAAIEGYLAGDDSRPLVVHGVSGTGKSALVAHVASEAAAGSADATVVIRFIGATAASTGGRGLLGDLCRQIGVVYGLTDPVPDDLQELTEMFPERLALATAEKPLLVFIDAVDQLAAGDAARRLGWLPGELPEHVRIVISTLPGDTYDAAVSRDPAMVEVTSMPTHEAEKLLEVWLEDARRDLQPDQHTEILEAFSEADGLPLYLKLAFEEARLWRSDGEHPSLASNVESLIRDNLFARLQEPANHGPLLVERSLGYLAASRYGLAEDEIIDVLSRDDDVFASIADQPYHDIPDTGATRQRIPVVVWARLYADLQPYLTERATDGATTLDYYHRQFREVSTSSYLEGGDGLSRHGVLADLFRSKADPEEDFTWTGGDIRGLAELPYHLTEAERFDDVYEVLTDFRFMERKVAEVGIVQQADGRPMYTGVSRLREDFDHTLAGMPGGEGDSGGRAVIVTATDFGKGAGYQVRCPFCNRYSDVEEGWLGIEIECPQEGCGKPLKVNSFMVPAASP